MKNLFKSFFLVFLVSGFAGYISLITIGNFWYTFCFFALLQYILYSFVLSIITNYFKEKTKQKELDKLENLSTILECAYCNTKNVLTFIPDQNQKIQFKCTNCNNINSVLLQFTVARTTEPVEITSILKQLS